MGQTRFIYIDDRKPVASVTDYDGNVYTPITIGTQTWLKENMKATKTRDGSSTTYKYYNDSAVTGATYGCLYPGDVAYSGNTGADNRNIMPVGYRCATVADWDTLIAFVGANPGGALKETGTSHWASPNTGALNTYGFTALPGGIYTSPNFSQITLYGQWWTSSGGNDPTCYYMPNSDATCVKTTANWAIYRAIRGIKI